VSVKSYNYGVGVTTIWYEKAIKKERDRLEKANADAIAEANSSVKKLEQVLRERNATIAKLNEQAASDPNADNQSVSPDGVLRLNRIR
jgi:hypothetical protein